MIQSRHRAAKGIPIHSPLLRHSLLTPDQAPTTRIRRLISSLTLTQTFTLHRIDTCAPRAKQPLSPDRFSRLPVSSLCTSLPRAHHSLVVVGVDVSEASAELRLTVGGARRPQASVNATRAARRSSATAILVPERTRYGLSTYTH